MKIDSFKDREKKITKILERAAREKDEEQRLDSIKLGYTHLRCACEVIVEQELLKDVVARYRPNIRMTCIRQINAERLPQAIGTIMEIFDKCSRFPEVHSQPLSAIEALPSIQELTEDLATVKNALKVYNQK